MIHRYNLWIDLLRPWIYRLVGHQYACCPQFRNCTKCVRDKKWEVGGVRRRKDAKTD